MIVDNRRSTTSQITEAHESADRPTRTWIPVLPASLRGRIGRNVGWLTGGRGIALLGGAVTSIVVVRHLGPAGFGTYSFAVAIVGLVSAAATLSPTLVVRELVAAAERRRQVLGSTAAIMLGLVAVAELVLALLILLAEPADRTGVRAMTAILAIGVLATPLNVIDFRFQSELQARYSVTARSLGVVVTTTGAVLVSALGGGGVWLAVASVAGSATVALGYLSFYRRLGEPLRSWRVDLATMRALARRAAPLMVSAAAIAVYMRVDQVMLGWLSNRTQVGLYAAVVRLSEFCYFVPMIVSTSVTPLLVERRSGPLHRYHDALMHVFSYLVAAAAAIICVTLVFAGPIVRLLFGAAYAGAVPVLRVHIVSSLFVFIGVAASVYVVNEGLERLLMTKTLLGAIVNVGLNLVLLPRYGALGAAWATLVAYVVATLGGDLLFSSTRTLFRLEVASFSPRRLLGYARVDLLGYGVQASEDG